MVEFQVEHGDILKVPADVLLLKYAQGFYGGDRQVAIALISSRRSLEDQIQPRPDQVAWADTQGIMAPRRVLFVGTDSLAKFGYEEMRRFARRAVEALADQGAAVQTVSTTVHGVHYGLDATEALQSLICGFREGLEAHPGVSLQRITFVELNQRRARLLAQALQDLKDQGLPGGSPAKAPPVVKGVTVKVAPIAATAPNKDHVFVAMAFSEESQDVYEFGIYEPVRRCGLICERVDEAIFTGDILQRIKERIRSAKLVIADLTGGRPNVYLEVGYAWGHNVPVVLLAKKGECLHFDVTTHRCLFYTRIGQLAKDLEKLIGGLCPVSN